MRDESSTHGLKNMFAVAFGFGISRETSPDAWADLVRLSPRHLHRLCELHCDVSPKRALALYNAIYFALRGEELPSCLGDIISNESTRLSKERDHYLESMEYLMSRHPVDVR